MANARSIVSFLAVLLTVLVTVSAAPIPSNLDKRIVYNPRITYPTKGAAIWTAGQAAHVSWDTSNIPAEASSGSLKIILGHIEQGSYNEHLDIDHPLAKNLPVTRGDWTFILPADLPTRHDYIVVLMGDSGNASPTFTIQSASAKNGSD